MLAHDVGGFVSQPFPDVYRSRRYRLTINGRPRRVRAVPAVKANLSTACSWSVSAVAPVNRQRTQDRKE